MKCPKCGIGKSRRHCARQGNTEICSECCASIRDAECGECVHYASVREYESSRRVSSKLPDGHFIVEINPAVQDAVNTALERAQRGDIQRAMATLTGLLREHPCNHDVCYGLGTLYAIQGESQEAIRWFDKAIAIYPYCIEAHFNRAVAYEKQMDVAMAVRSFRKVVEFGDPNEPEVTQAHAFIDHMAEVIQRTEGVGLDAYLQSGDQFNLAFELMEHGDWQCALTGFQAAMALNDGNAPSHGNTGLCHAYLGHKSLALAELDRAIELDPDYEPARRNRPLVENMAEGRPLEGTIFQSINYGLDGI